MASTGTYNFNEAASGLMLTAFGRIGIRRTAVQAEHLQDAFIEANLLQAEFSNRQPNLFQDELYTVSLTAGTATYTLPARMTNIQVPYLTTTDSSGNSFDRVLFPYSTYEYGAIPDKTQQAPPTAYWYNRSNPPQIVLWPVPDDNATYSLNLRILHQFEDVNFSGGTTVAAPYRWLDAWTSGLAARLALIYNPAIVGMMDAKAERAWTIAATQDAEDVPLYITAGGMSGYWR